jgi:hypothetical protein
MQFNQLNKNKGDVNNAIAATGSVVQSVGDQNKNQITEPKKKFWSLVWAKVAYCWKWITG